MVPVDPVRDLIRAPETDPARDKVKGPSPPPLTSLPRDLIYTVTANPLLHPELEEFLSINCPRY